MFSTNKRLVFFGSFLLFFISLQSLLFAKYISVVDSGSTGSEIHLFDITNENGIVKYKVIPLKDNDHHIGVSHISWELIGEYLAPLIKSLRNGLPSGIKESDVDFYFMSTGDMRAIPPPIQEKIFQNLKKYLKENTKLNVKIAGTMYEKMEGVFDWMGVNLHENKIGTDSTYGVIDIGGATIQVAYAVDDSSIKGQTVKIGKYTYVIHSRSYLGIGNDHFREQYLDNPSCIPKGLSLVTTTGNGDFKDCLSTVEILLRDVHHIEPIPSSILKKTQFVGIAYFYYLTNSKPFSLGDEISINDLKAKAEVFTKLSWNEMKDKWPQDQYLHNYYIGAALIIDLLKTLGFSPDTKIKAIHKSNGTEVSWALGAAVYFEEGNKYLLEDN